MKIERWEIWLANLEPVLVLSSTAVNQLLLLSMFCLLLHENRIAEFIQTKQFFQTEQQV